MGAAGFFYLALLILVLVPIVILPWEGRSTPNWLYGVLAAFGLTGAATLGGMPGLAWACAAGLGCMAVAGFAVTVLRARTRARVLTGGQIKLLGAGATWLGVNGTFAMVALAALALVLIAAFQRAGAVRRRPDASAVLAASILSVAMQHYLPGM